MTWLFEVAIRNNSQFFLHLWSNAFHWLHFITNYSFFLFPRVITNLLKYPHGQFSSLISVSIYIFNNSRKWQPSPIFLLLKSHGQRSLMGYSPEGRKESDMTEWLNKQYLCVCVCVCVCVQSIKNPPANAGDTEGASLIPGVGISSGERNGNLL